MASKIQLYALQDICFARFCTKANFPVTFLVQPPCHRRLLPGQYNSSHCPEELSHVVDCWLPLTDGGTFALADKA